MRRRTLFLMLWTLALATATAWIPLQGLTADLPDVEVRTVPRRTHGGKLLAEHPAGQGFRCRWNDLARIDVGLVSPGPAGDAALELVLRAGGPNGEVLRRSRTAPGELQGQGHFAAFEFEPLADSAGRELWFELGPPADASPSPYSPWIRFHGQPGHDTPWGNRIVVGTVIETALTNTSHEPDLLDPGNVPHPNLRALAFATDSVVPGSETLRLELFEEGREDPVREVELGSENEVHGGYLFFSFPPIEESRWKNYRYRVSLPPDSRLVGFELGPSVKSFHGAPVEGSPLLGASLGGVAYPDRDLVFRAWSSPSAGDVAALLRERTGGKEILAVLLWVLAIGLVLRVFVVR